MGKKKKAIVTTVIRYLIILIFCVPMIMPLLWMLTTALKDNAAVFAMPPQWIPKVFHWEKAYSRLNSGNALAILYLFP